MSNENNSNENSQNNVPSSAPKMQQINETPWGDYAITAVKYGAAFLAGVGAAILADKFFGNSGE